MKNKGHDEIIEKVSRDTGYSEDLEIGRASCRERV